MFSRARRSASASDARWVAYNIGAGSDLKRREPYRIGSESGVATAPLPSPTPLDPASWAWDPQHDRPLQKHAIRLLGARPLGR